MNIPHFAGTGVDNKPRVLVAKAEYHLRHFEALKTHPDIEFVGFATDSDQFEAALITDSPDVVIMGTDLDEVYPIESLRNLFSPEKQIDGFELPGVVLNSRNRLAMALDKQTLEELHRSRGNIFSKEGELPFNPLPYAEVYGRANDPQTFADQLVAAVKQADPFKIHAAS